LHLRVELQKAKALRTGQVIEPEAKMVIPDELIKRIRKMPSIQEQIQPISTMTIINTRANYF